MGLPPKSPPGARSRRIVFVNRFFPPDHSATSQLLGDLSAHLAQQSQGWGEIHVVTSRLFYDGGAPLPPVQSWQGVKVHRVWSSAFGRHSLPGRAVDAMTFMLAAGWQLWCLLRRG
ncbi:MAG: hypothetical protein H7831_00975, partial [Magnetococcus sp. WYHC-3]